MRGYEESPAVYTDFLTAKGKQIYTTKGLTKRVKIRDLHGCRNRTEEHPLAKKSSMARTLHYHACTIHLIDQR